MSDKMKEPFVFHPSLEALEHFKNATAEEKLNWLEDAAQFVKDFVPAEKLQKWMKYSRTGSEKD
jgi:hypothetical protein